MKITNVQTYLVDTRGLIKWVFVKRSRSPQRTGTCASLRPRA